MDGLAGTRTTKWRRGRAWACGYGRARWRTHHKTGDEELDGDGYLHEDFFAEEKVLVAHDLRGAEERSVEERSVEERSGEERRGGVSGASGERREQTAACGVSGEQHAA